MNLFCCILVLKFFVGCVFTQLDTYRAAVIEYAPRRSGYSPIDYLIAHKRDYEKYISQAAQAGAEIIVFPELGLTGWGIDKNSLEQLSSEVPDPNSKVSPCSRNQFGNYSKFFTDLSCAAQGSQIYTVVNLIEQEEDNYNKRKVFYNTNVVFDRKGVVIARYRKINLYDEAVYEPGPNTKSIFIADFGVKFGILTSSDILFKSPALDILDDEEVTDVILPSAWFSELPFYGGLSILHGYAKSNGVNLLASGLNEPGIGSGGSGIFLFDGRVVETYISGSKTSKLMIQHVPKIRVRKNLINTCQGASAFVRPPVNFGHFSEMGVFHTVESNLVSYSYKPLDIGSRHIMDTICSLNSDFCCTFNITVSSNSASAQSYIYKLIAFFGISQVSSLSKTLGQRNCALVACLNDNINSCGGRNVHPPSGIVFEHVSVRGLFNTRNSYQQPSSLRHDLNPITDYMYCTRTSGDDLDITMVTTRSQDSLLTFGIVGRVFDYDGEQEGLLSGGSKITLAHFWLFSFCIFAFIFAKL